VYAALRQIRQVSHSFKFIIWTDEQHDFALPPNEVSFRKAPKEPGNVHDALTEMHSRVLREAPHDSMVCLLNADIIPSEELFTVGQLALSSNFRVVASFGLRVLWQSPMEVPPSHSAKALLEWGWRHKHPVVDNCIWGSGKTAFPLPMFFVNGHSNAVAHCSHLHPFLIRKDGREFQFRGTIDDGLLHLYKDDEVYYPGNREIGFVELSEHNLAPHFMVVREQMLDEDFVCEFGKHFLTTHCRNMRQAFRIIGNATVYDAPAIRIADRIGGNL